MNKWMLGIISIVILCGGILLIFFKLSLLIVSPFVSESITSVIPQAYTPPQLTFEKIFEENHTWTSDIPEKEKWTLIATGDVIPARSVNYKTIQYNDFTWAWKNIAPILSSGDVTLVNLESPFIANCPVTNTGMVFCGDQRHMEGLLLSGVDVANFANNHMGNWGIEGIEETKELMLKNEIQISGLGEAAMKDVKGTKVAFLGFDDIGPHVLPVADANEQELERQIKKAKLLADIVVVSIHWGVEYTDKPSDRQIFLAHLAVDSGADLIIGNHPHWIQPLELYQGKVIMYAHGNTIFDQMWSEETKFGVIGKYTFYGKSLVDIEFIPTYIKDYGQPEVLEGDNKMRIIENLQTISLPE